MTSIALATCADLPDLDPDDQHLRRALLARDTAVDVVVWDDPGVVWDRYDLTVVRSVWDYPSRREAFLAWSETVPRLANPAPVLRWNTDKTYLRDLAAAGVATIPTAFLDPAALASAPSAKVLADAVATLPESGQIVLKPSVGAGSKGAGGYDVGIAGEREQAAAHAAALAAAGSTVMVQPYLDAVDDAGETAVVVFAGTPSHGIRKGAMLRGAAASTDALFHEEHITARTPSDPELATAAQVLAALPAGWVTPLYARVDLVPAADGTPTVMEVELTEPSLFLGTTPGTTAADRFADAVLALALTEC